MVNKMQILSRFWCGFISIFLLAVLVTAPVMAKVAPAGTTISNRAEISWFDTADGRVKRIYSNVSEIVVAKQLALRLESNILRHASAGQQVSLPHRLTNTGNIASGYELQIIPHANDSGDLSNLKIYQDTNGNGIASAGEPEILPVSCLDGSTDRLCFQLPTLSSGEIFEFVYKGKTSVNDQAGDIYRLDVIVLPLNHTDKAEKNTDTVDILEGANLAIIKSSAPVCGTPIGPNDTIKFSLNFTNTGDSKPTAKDFIIDDETISGVVLEDIIHSNLILGKMPIPENAPIQSIVLVQLEKDKDTSRWSKFEAWNGSDIVSKIGLYIPVDKIDSNHSGKLIYELVASDKITTKTTVASASFDHGSDIEFVSNSICTTLVPNTPNNGGEGSHGEGENNDAEIRFLTPILDLKRDKKSPNFYTDSDFEDAQFYRLDHGLKEYLPSRDGVYIEVHSSGLNEDEDKVEIHTVTLTSGSGDILYVIVKETGPNTGIFRAIRPIRLSSLDKGAGKTCPANGEVEAAYTDFIDTSCTLHGASDGSIKVTIQDTGIGQLLKDAGLIEPLGVVFDSAFNTPIKGAIVTIRTVNGSLAIDPLSPSLSPYEPYVTKEDGKYQFPYLYPSDYYIHVIPPGKYSFPSKIPLTSFIDRNVNEYSYGEDGFTGETDSGVFTLRSLLVADIPLDPDTVKALAIEKSASSTETGVGDFVTYTVKIDNYTKQSLYAVKVEDRLPYGFRYVEGSTFLDGKRIDDPIGVPGPNLSFTSLPFVENAADGVLDTKTHTLVYRLRVSAGAVDSDGINSAVADGRTATSYHLSSNVSKVKVKISQSGVLSDSGIIFGKVFVDADCSNVQSQGEWPIGGVKLYMEDGTWVITDGNGQYSLYGIKPGNHVIKIDALTLPEGVHLKPIDNRHMADPDSRLVDMKRGGFHRADFAAMCPQEDPEVVFEQIMSRNNGRTDWMIENASKYDPDKDVSTSDLRKKTGADGDLSHGAVGFSREANNAGVDTNKGINRGYSLQLGKFSSQSKAEQMISKLPRTMRSNAFIYSAGDFYTVRLGFNVSKSRMAHYQTQVKKRNIESKVVATVYERLPATVLEKLESPNATVAMAQPKKVVKLITKKQAKTGTWLWPKGDTSLDGRFMVVIRAGMTPTLKVNGKNIPSSKIGERIENRKERAQIVAWYGVELKAGENQVEVFAKDPFGNSRTLVKGVFKRPTIAERMKLVVESDELEADGGRSYLPITIKMLDANGYPARGIHFVTLEASDGTWLERDIQDQTPGRQVRILNGERTVHLRSSERTGDITIRVSDGKLEAETQVVQTAPLRPLMAVGILELGASKSRFSSNSNVPDSQLDKITRRGRGAVFMKGRIRGNVHLTLSYDSDKDVDGERFRDINPNAQYPVYGDDSQRGYEAQSRSKLYAKVEKNKNSLMYGDYLTDSQSNHESVARVQRSLTGINGVLDNGKTRLQVYASRPTDNHVANEEIRGKGTALNYRLQHHPLIRNSEVIEIVTYSRDNPGVVININKLTRFGGYTLDDLTGDLSFTDAIPSLDENQNPIFIRASYDLEGNGEEYNVAGIRLNHQLTDKLNVGVSHSYDDNQTDGKKITGVSAEYKNNDSRVTASVATLKHKDITKEDGKAVRLSVEQKWNADSKTNITYGRADKGYDNQSGGITSDREELRIAHRQKISKNVGVEVEGIHSKGLSDDAVQQSLGVTADAKVGDVTLKAGVRHIRQKNSADSDSFNTVIVGAKTPINIAERKGNISAEYEQDIGNAERKRMSIGADLQVHEKAKIYVKAERINSLTGVSGLSEEQSQDTFSAGVKSTILPSTEIYSEYRLRGVTDGRDLETASGIRGDYEIEKGLSIAPRLEIVNSIKGAGKDSVAVSVGFKDVRSKNERKTARIEVRHDDKRDYYGAEGTYVARLDEEWSILLRDSLRVDLPDEGEDQYSNTFSVGLAHRPRMNNKHSMLFLYENKLKRGFEDEGDCDKHVLSTHQNYEIDEAITISGRVGGKYEKCSKGDADITTNAALVDGRVIWDIDNRLDADVHGGMLTTNSFKERQYSAGLGLNYLLQENMRVGLGYNVKGFEDKDLDTEGYNKQGVYVGMQYKFDEKNLGWLSGEKQPDRNRVEMPMTNHIDTTNNKNKIEDSSRKNEKSALDIFGSWFGE